MPIFNLLKPEWSNCERFSSIRGMNGLNIEVSENLPVEDGYMRYKDDNLTFMGSSARLYCLMYCGDINGK